MIPTIKITRTITPPTTPMEFFTAPIRIQISGNVLTTDYGADHVVGAIRGLQVPRRCR